MGPSDPTPSDALDGEDAQRARAFFSATRDQQQANAPLIDEGIAAAGLALGDALGPPDGYGDGYGDGYEDEDEHEDADAADADGGGDGDGDATETDLLDRPAPTGRPVFDTDLDGATAALDPGATVDLRTLVPYLDAQLELTRQRAEEGIERVLAALAAIEARVGDVEELGADLFDWLESYVGWESATLAELGGRTSTTGPPPAPPPGDLGSP